jgi:hypothetical protein
MSKFRQHALAIVFGVLACNATVLSPVVAAEPPGIYMQELTAAKASKKVAAVLWTRRSDSYTLQVVFPKESAKRAFAPPDKHPAVRLWLLKADGLVMSAARVPPKEGEASTPAQNEQSYSVSLSAGETAVAAVLQIDDQYFVDAILPTGEK